MKHTRFADANVVIIEPGARYRNRCFVSSDGAVITTAQALDDDGGTTFVIGATDLQGRAYTEVYRVTEKFTDRNLAILHAEAESTRTVQYLVPRRNPPVAGESVMFISKRLLPKSPQHGAWEASADVASYKLLQPTRVVGEHSRDFVILADGSVTGVSGAPLLDRAGQLVALLGGQPHYLNEKSTWDEPDAAAPVVTGAVLDALMGR